LLGALGALEAIGGGKSNPPDEPCDPAESGHEQAASEHPQAVSRDGATKTIWSRSACLRMNEDRSRSMQRS